MFKPVKETNNLEDVRSNATVINENFVGAREVLGLEFEMINIGEQPGDGTGDMIREGMAKVNRNFEQVAKLIRFLKGG